MSIEVDLGCEVIAVKKFTELTDTPNSYSGQAGKLATVNGTEDGLEFSDAPTSGVSTVTGDGVGGTATDVVMSYPTPTDIGLSNVDNTSDANKPVSTATQTALDLKADQSDLDLTNTQVLNNTTALDTKRPNISFITKTADYTPSGELDNTYINVDSATDKTITFDTGAFAKDGDVVFFERINTGRILFANGTASISAAPNLSLISGGVGSIVAVIRKSASVYILTGTTE